MSLIILLIKGASVRGKFMPQNMASATEPTYQAVGSDHQYKLIVLV